MYTQKSARYRDEEGREEEREEEMRTEDRGKEGGREKGQKLATDHSVNTRQAAPVRRNLTLPARPSPALLLGFSKVAEVLPCLTTSSSRCGWTL